MHPLYQRLKELDWDTFQRLCFQLLKDRHQGLELRHVEGQGGDEGLDIFVGQLFGQLAIWQCKSFPNGIGKSQREQIKKSLRSAVKNFSVSHWILCLSVDMDPKALKWFEKLKASYASRVTIRLFAASDIVHQLIHRKSVREAFFPGAVTDLIELKRVISKSEELSLEELERLTENNLEDYIERLKDRDARFTYEFVFNPDSGPQSQRAVPNLVMSLSNGAKTVNILARDIQALLSNPPTSKIALTGTGIEKALVLQKKGLHQQFTSDEFELISSDFPLVKDLLPGSPFKRLEVGPSPEMTGRKRAVRVTFRKPGGAQIEYALMYVSPTRVGTEEAEFICKSKNTFFEIAVVLPLPIDVRNVHPQITIRHSAFAEQDVKHVRKFLDAMALLTPAGQIEFFDLTTERPFVTVSSSDFPAETANERKFRQLVNDLTTISQHFQISLRVPADMTNEDWESIVLLKTYLDGGTLPHESFSGVLLKSEENQELVPQMLTESGGRLRLVRERHEPQPKLFGVSIDTGPCAVEAEVRPKNLEATLAEFRNAAIGDGVKFSFHATSPIRFWLLTGANETNAPG